MTGALRAALIAVALVASGIAGLAYEVVWARYLALFVGSTGKAHLIILATFMGGLALGAKLLGPRADRARSALMLYAAIEGGIAFCGAIYPAVFEPLRSLFLSVARGLGGEPWAVVFASTIVALASILPGAILMGGTTPVLLRAVARRDASLGRSISLLYFLNSLGGAAGALWSGLWAIPVLGLAGTSRAAAALNVVAALCALVLTRERAALEPSRATAAAAAPMALPASAIRAALVAAGIAGFVSFVFEVAWIRMLTLVLGSAPYAFPLMLGAFILGIAGGSLALSFRRGADGWLGMLAWAQLLVGGSGLVSLCYYERLPVLVNHIRLSLEPRHENYDTFLALQFGLCLLAMLVPTFAMGLSFPAAARVVARTVANSGATFGKLIGINTVGTVLGALVGGGVLMPALGLRHTLELASAASILLGLWVLRSAIMHSDASARAMHRAVFFIVGAGAIYAVFPPEWDNRMFNSALYREKARLVSYESARKGLDARKLIYHRDGIDATVAVAQHTEIGPDGAPVLSLLINGKVDASSTHDMQTQLLLGHLPMMLHRAPKDVLVVGLGAGVTAGAVLAGGAERVDCVELIPEVVEAARLFAAQNNDVLGDPRFHLHVQDAKTHLLLTGRTYDVIVNEPTNLWVAGVPGLFTREHLDAAAKRLRPGGLYLEWLHTYEMQDASYWRLVSTFQDVFPCMTIFNSGGDVFLIGSRTPFAPDFVRMEGYVESRGVARQLGLFGIRGLLPILAMQVAAKTETNAPLILPREACSDFHPSLDYECAEAFFLDAAAYSAAIIDERSLAPARSGLWMKSWKPNRAPEERDFAAYLAGLRRLPSTFGGIEGAWARMWLARFPKSALAKRTVESIESEAMSAAQKMRASATLDGSRQGLVLHAAAMYLTYAQTRNFAWAADPAELFNSLSELVQMHTPEEAWALTVEGDLSMDAGRPADAVEYYRLAQAVWAGSREPSLTPPVELDALLLRLAEAQMQAGRLAEARAVLAQLPLPDAPAPVPDPRELLECKLLQLERRSQSTTIQPK